MRKSKTFKIIGMSALLLTTIYQGLLASTVTEKEIARHQVASQSGLSFTECTVVPRHNPAVPFYRAAMEVANWYSPAATDIFGRESFRANPEGVRAYLQERALAIKLLQQATDSQPADFSTDAKFCFGREGLNTLALRSLTQLVCLEMMSQADLGNYAEVNRLGLNLGLMIRRLSLGGDRVGHIVKSVYCEELGETVRELEEYYPDADFSQLKQETALLKAHLKSELESLQAYHPGLIDEELESARQCGNATTTLTSNMEEAACWAALQRALPYIRSHNSERLFELSESLGEGPAKTYIRGWASTVEFHNRAVSKLS